jgi:NAD(P)-dependent dehydrogenase (short-subunit alcohol dehydrogenase family)
MSAAMPKIYREPPPPQEQQPPGSQEQMRPQPVDENENYVASGKLEGKVAIVTGGDSGIGRSVAILFAKEGADICIVYLNEHDDAKKTVNRIKEIGRNVISISGDIGDPTFCEKVVQQTLDEFEKIDVLINNAGQQDVVSGVEGLEPEHVEKIFRTNLFGFFYLTKAVLPHLKRGASIVNSTSIQAYDPSPQLMDYACTKAAIMNFTRSLATELAEKEIRVNAVAPGPIWTPLIPTSFKGDQMEDFGKKTLFKRPGQPVEMAPAYLFFASDAFSSYVTGQVLHANGGQGMFS